MAETVFQQTALIGSNTVAFRNHSDEPWLLYRTPMNHAFISLSADKHGYAPQPDWVRIDG